MIEGYNSIGLLGADDGLYRQINGSGRKNPAVRVHVHALGERFILFQNGVQFMSGSAPQFIALCF